MKQWLILSTLLLTAFGVQSQPLSDLSSGLKFRSIGPAFMSGRIADIAIHPQNRHTWYVAVGSGGVWKTENAGTTWKPLFDQQQSYSIGCITLDPQNPSTIWVGTGENVGGRHVGFGDGIYSSKNGGETWEHKGLKFSEHISKIIVHPHNSDVLWVAAQGPLWSKGGERGVYKTTDGGKTWEKTLGDAEWVGATDLIIHPQNPDILYAATWQRHRTVAGYMGGGPGTAIYRSINGGKSWEKLEQGLPKGNLGKIGLAISSQNPSVVYAAIEQERRTGGVYRSDNNGHHWQKMSDAIAGGTGPHYYQELYACPHQFDKLYLVNVNMLVSEDGGKTFKSMNEQNKHVDNHAIAFVNDDPNYLLVGCDGGLYESFDQTKSWKYIANLPITQFYKIALSDETPFYHVYGGTQDNNTQGAPIRTDNNSGIRNADWFVVLWGDGHQPATEPGNPNIVYAQWQQGNLVRHDRKTGENVFIQPMGAPNEPADRFNWDAPILVSPHNPQKLYFASNRVWMSENRGDTWTPISGNLSRNIARIQTPFYGNTQGWNNAWDLYAMSDYGTITSLSESPIKPGLLYAGTDDGSLHLTEDGGNNWQSIPFNRFPNLPTMAFINDIKADLHHENTVYIAFDHHKYGVYKPLLYKSQDKGKTWQQITNGLPDQTLVWRIVQDHLNKDLLFLGTEFGLYVSLNGGNKWWPLKGGMPTIPIRDLAIQKTENDLVMATFGRGIYVYDDYSALRQIDTMQQARNNAKLFAPRHAWWYLPRPILGGGKGSQGDAYFIADNPPFGVNFTLYLPEMPKSLADKRKDEEVEAIKTGKIISTPDWDILDQETNEKKLAAWLYIFTTDGALINKLPLQNKKGFQQVSWNLRQLQLRQVPTFNKKLPEGSMVAPGNYKAQIYLQYEDSFSFAGEAVNFEIKPLRTGSLPQTTPEEVAVFWKKHQQCSQQFQELKTNLSQTQNLVKQLETAMSLSPKQNSELYPELSTLAKLLNILLTEIEGQPSRKQVGEKEANNLISDYLWSVQAGTAYSTHGPSEMHTQWLQYAETLISEKAERLAQYQAQAQSIAQKLQEAGVPPLEKH